MKIFLAFNLSDVFTMLINIKIPTIVGINIYIYQCVYEHDKYIFELSMKKVLITSGPVFL